MASAPVVSFLLILVCLIVNALTQKDVGPWNMRGYIDYPRIGLGALRPLQLQVVFDYDQETIPYLSKVEIVCQGYQRRNDSCNGDQKIEDEIAQNRTPTWFANTTNVVKPFNPIIFETREDIDLYECRGRILQIQENGTFIIGNWSSWAEIRLRNCSLIEPSPSLLVCHSMQDPETAWNDRFMIRTFDVHAGNGPNETVDAEFTERWPLAYNGMGNHTTFFQQFCFDWLGHWEYRVTPTRNCIIVVDMYKTMTPEYVIDADCRKDIFIDDVLCYSLRNQVFFTTRHQNSTVWSIKVFDGDVNKTRPLIGPNATAVGCNLNVTHAKLIFDWRLFYKRGNRSETDPRIVFVSSDHLWTYSIQDEVCEQFLPLTSLGVKNISKVIRFGIDWRYFYWIDHDSRLVKAFSLEDRNTTNLTTVQVYGSEQRAWDRKINKRILENITYAMDLMTFTAAERPFPHPVDCLIPKILLTVRMNTETTATVDMTKIWNTSEICKKYSQPPIQVLLFCQPIDPDTTPECNFIEYTKRMRSPRYSVEVQNLVLGKKYRVSINASFFDILDTYTVTSKDFLAVTPNLTLKISLSVAAVAFVLLVAASITFRKLYKRHRYWNTIRRDQLRIKRELGRGAFARVYKVDYSTEGTRTGFCNFCPICWTQSRRNNNRRRSNGNRSGNKIEQNRLPEVKTAAAKALLQGHDSSTGFIDEMLLLGEINHQNVIKVFGICQNFPMIDSDQEIDFSDIYRQSSSEDEQDSNVDRDESEFSYVRVVQVSGPSTRALILEYMNAGSCVSYIDLFQYEILNRDLLSIARDIAEALAYLSDQRIVHRDLASRNVLVQVEMEDGTKIRRVQIAKLADFGLAKKANYNRKEGLWACKGLEGDKKCLRTLAPEAFEHVFTTYSDVWAFGIFMWELYTLIYKEKGKKFTTTPYDNVLDEDEDEEEEEEESDEENSSERSADNSGPIVFENFHNSDLDTVPRRFVNQQNDGDTVPSVALSTNETRDTAPLLATTNNVYLDSGNETNDTVPLITVTKNENGDTVPQISKTQIEDGKEEEEMPKEHNEEKIKAYLRKGENDKTFVPFKKPEAASEEVYEKMKFCWAYKPTDRPTFKFLSRALALLISKEPNEDKVSPLYKKSFEGRNRNNDSERRSIDNIDLSDRRDQSDQTEDTDQSDRSVPVYAVLADVHKEGNTITENGIINFFGNNIDST